MTKYRVVIDLECESKNLLDEVVLDFENLICDSPVLEAKVGRIKVTGEELEYKDVKII